jgi:hypothetical protein
MGRPGIVRNFVLCGFLGIVLIFNGPSLAQDVIDASKPVLESYDLPPVGAAWSFLFTDRRGIEHQQDWERLADGELRGKKVNRYRVGNTTRIFDALTRGWMATLDESGRPLYSADPYQEVVQLPLYEGKAWITRYSWRDHAGGQSWHEMVDRLEVKGLTTITVPAGTFEAWLYESRPVANNEVTHTVWLVPDLGITVRAESIYSEQHYKGPGKTKRELTWFWKDGDRSQ